MLNKPIKKLIKRYLFEIRGQVPKINIISSKISKSLYSLIQNTDSDNFKTILTLNSDVLSIGEITFYCSKTIKNGGGINLNTVTKFDGFYNLIIEISYNENISIEHIDSIISHELHHFYDSYVFKLSGREKIKSYLELLTSLKIDFQGNSNMKDFIECFYLSSDHELNARVHQLSTDLKYYTGDDVITFFKKSGSYNDGIKLTNYKSNIDMLSNSDKEKLLKLVNNVHKNSGKVRFNNFEQLNKYFTKRFLNKGYKYLKKLSKIVSDKYQIDNSKLLSETIFQDIII